MLLALPVAFQVEAEFIENTPQKVLRSLAEANGFTFVDALPAFRQRRGESLYYDHCHPTPRGNRILGELLADALVSQRTSKTLDKSGEHPTAPN